MIRQFLVGGAVSLLNITVHALVMTTVVHVARAANSSAKKMSFPSPFLIVVMVPTVAVLMAAHAVEVVIWALAYQIFDAAPPDAELVYFAFVNYTTLGYGDVLPAQNWRLLGPITAMNGIILFGWSTAIIFEVLRKTLRSGQGSKKRR